MVTHLNEEKGRTEGQIHIFDIYSELENCPASVVSLHRRFVVLLFISQTNSLIFSLVLSAELTVWRWPPRTSCAGRATSWPCSCSRTSWLWQRGSPTRRWASQGHQARLAWQEQAQWDMDRGCSRPRWDFKFVVGAAIIACCLCDQKYAVERKLQIGKPKTRLVAIAALPIWIGQPATIQKASMKRAVSSMMPRWITTIQQNLDHSWPIKNIQLLLGRHQGYWSQRQGSLFVILPLQPWQLKIRLFPYRQLKIRFFSITNWKISVFTAFNSLFARNVHVWGITNANKQD